ERVCGSPLEVPRVAEDGAGQLRGIDDRLCAGARIELLLRCRADDPRSFRITPGSASRAPNRYEWSCAFAAELYGAVGRVSLGHWCHTSHPAFNSNASRGT